MAGIGAISRHAKVKVVDIHRVFKAIAYFAKMGEKVTIKNFGTFRLSKRKSRKYSTPVVGDFAVPEHFAIVFRAIRDLRIITPKTESSSAPKVKRQPIPGKRTGSSLKRKPKIKE